MNREEQLSRDNRVQFIRRRLADMEDDIAASRAPDGVVVGYRDQAIKYMQELKRYGETIENTSTFIALAAVKAGVQLTAQAGEAWVEVKPAALEGADAAATKQA